jgi:microsomal dipeptidase-like Zn-dependent dipeptidase
MSWSEHPGERDGEARGTRSARRGFWNVRLPGATVLGAILAIGAIGSCTHVPPAPSPAPTNAPPTTEAPGVPLSGFVDLHTHPLSSLGFAGKLVYGGIDFAPDGGALLPADPDCNEDQRAKTLYQALGHDGSTHGSWGLDLNPKDVLAGKGGETNKCGDTIRQQVIAAVQELNFANNPASDATGYVDGGADFAEWPKSDDVTHQAMYVDWIRRTYEAGLRVMVALAVNNQTLADTVAGPGDGPDDDMDSADLQIREIKALASRHADWMEVAYSSSDLARIVSQKKLAIVLGLEVDNIGNFNRKDPAPTEEEIRVEIARLHAEGVRYLFPIHMIDNPFGSTAAYQDLFNLSNLRESGHFWHLVCAQPADHVNYQYKMGNPLELNSPSLLTAEMAALMVVKLGMLSDTFDAPTIPKGCPDGGWVNQGVPYPGLTPLGQFAIQEMMRQGMFIDIDHMSQASANDALTLAEREQYPVESGHNGIRDPNGGTERSFTADQYARIGKLHGMAGVGSASLDDIHWVANFNAVAAAMNREVDGGLPGALDFGTDTDGVSPLMLAPDGGPRVVYSAQFPKSTLGSKSWDYNVDGVAHYGMIADFLEGVPRVNGGQDVRGKMMKGAQYFYDTWKRMEAYSVQHQAGSVVAALASTTPSPAGASATPNAAAAALGESAEPACPSGSVYRRACKVCLRPRERCPSLPPVTCPPGRKPDKWGLCFAGAARATPSAAASPMTPVKASGVSLSPGNYTLVLAGPRKSAAEPERKRAGFDVVVTSNGPSISLRSRTGKAGKKGVEGTGAFRSNGADREERRRTRFVMRLDLGDDVLLLTASAANDGKLTRLRGGFVGHRPGGSALTGTFWLEPASTFKNARTGIRPYEAIGLFLAELRK